MFSPSGLLSRVIAYLRVGRYVNGGWGDVPHRFIPSPYSVGSIMATYELDKGLSREILTLSLQDTEDRQSGPPHVSHLVQCLTKSWYQRSGLKGAPNDQRTLATFLTGKAHHAIIQALPMHDGFQAEVPFINQTIPMQGKKDGVLYVQHLGQKAVAEIKSTRYSSKKAPDEMPHYVEQLAAYCLDEGTNLGILVILHMMGDYQEGNKSELKVWTLRFTRDELDEYREELRDRAAVLSMPVVPRVGSQLDWECGYCPYEASKGGPCPGGPGRKTGFFALHEGRDSDQ